MQKNNNTFFSYFFLNQGSPLVDTLTLSTEFSLHTSMLNTINLTLLNLAYNFRSNLVYGNVPNNKIIKLFQLCYENYVQI